jgi:hypothetical protein
MIPMSSRSAIAVTSRIARVQQTRRCIRKYFGLRIVGKPASYADPSILQVLERGFYVIPHPVSQGAKPGRLAPVPVDSVEGNGKVFVLGFESKIVEAQSASFDDS